MRLLKIATLYSQLNVTAEHEHEPKTPFATHETNKQPQALRPPVPPEHQPALSVMKRLK